MIPIFQTRFGSHLLLYYQEPSKKISSVPILEEEPSPVPFLVLFHSQEPSFVFFHGLFLKVEQFPNDLIFRVYFMI